MITTTLLRHYYDTQVKMALLFGICEFSDVFNWNTDSNINLVFMSFMQESSSSVFGGS